MTSSPSELMIASDTIPFSNTPDKKKRRRRQKKIPSESSSTTSDDASSMRSLSPPRQRLRKVKGATPPQQMPSLTCEEKSQYIAMDCEMVGVGPCGQWSALARVCLIDWNGKKIMDAFVRPTEEVTDYRTFVSGITEEDLESDKAMDMEECRVRVQAHIEGKVLVGHALKNDLQVLGITHPWHATRDTGKYEPFMKLRFDDGVLWPRKLKDLAKEKLGRDIQKSGVSHSAFEDAKTALDLYKLVRRKWEKAMEYKINKTKEIERSHNLKVGSVEAELQLAQ